MWILLIILSTGTVVVLFQPARHGNKRLLFHREMAVSHLKYFVFVTFSAFVKDMLPRHQQQQM